MAEVVEKVIKIETTGSEQTVKGLKKEIDSLRDALLNTEKGTDEYNKVLESLINDQKRLADTMNAGKKEISAATGSYNALKVEMSALKKVWAEVTDEASRGEIGRRIDEINSELKEMDASIGNYQRNVGNYAGAFKNARQELAALKTTMDNVEAGSAEYAAAFQRAAEITHTLRERQEMLRYSAADLGTQLDNVVSIGSSIAAGFNSVNAVMALTGKKSEDLQKTMLKLQAGIALVQGLKGLEGLVKRSRGLVDGLAEMIFKTNEATVAVNAESGALALNTAAQGANTVATKAATVATKGFSKALIATGIGAIIVLIGTLIAHWEDLKNVVVESVGGVDVFNQYFDKARVIIAGVANVIYKYFESSIKNSITYVQTLGKVLADVFTFKWDKIGQDIREGMSKIVANVREGWNIVGNYTAGAARRQAEIASERTRQRMAASAKEMDDYIKDREAELGAEWKFTEEGKRAYEDYYATKLASYKQDSDEYRQTLREKKAYLREYTESLNRGGLGSSIKINDDDTAESLEEALAKIEKIQKRISESKMTAQEVELSRLKAAYDEEVALYEQYELDTTELTEEYEKRKAEIEKKYADKEEADKQRKLKEDTDKIVNALEARLSSLDLENTHIVTSIELEYSLKEAQGTGSLSINDLIEKTNRIYEANKANLQAQADEYKQVMENTEITDEARLKAKQDYEETLIELSNLETQNIIDNTNLQKEAIEAQIEMYSQLAGAIADIFASIADIIENDIKVKVKNGKITQEEGEKQFKAVKAFQIAEATINTIAGAIAAFMSCQTTYPQPLGAIIGAVQAAAVTAAGVAQIAKIKSTQLGSSSNVSSSMNAVATQTPVEDYVAPYTQNYTGESEITSLIDTIKDQKVILVESDVSDALEKAKRVRVESTF